MSKLVVNWTAPAIVDVKEAWGFIAEDNEAAADQTVNRIETAAEVLTQFPKLGRRGKFGRTREFSVAGTPFRLVYEVTKTAIEVRRVMNGARHWPSKRRRRS